MTANYNQKDLLNATARSLWVKQQFDKVKSNFYDGINLDFEEPILESQKDLRDAYTALVKETYTFFKQANPHYQVC